MLSVFQGYSESTHGNGVSARRMPYKVLREVVGTKSSCSRDAKDAVWPEEKKKNNNLDEKQISQQKMLERD